MLYQTTLGNKDAYTAYRAMREQAAPDGGLYVPLRLEAFDAQQLAALRDLRFSDCVAQILNRFFSSRVSGAEVAFAVGRNPVRLTAMSYRILIAQLWHNPTWQFTGMADALASCVCADKPERWSDWVQIAVRVAVLFGLFGEPALQESVPAGTAPDVAVRCGDFSAVMSAWYARKMGLPIRKILVACDPESALWELLRSGKARVDARTLPRGAERLVFDVFGAEAARRLHTARNVGGVFSLADTPEAAALRKTLFVSVVGSERAEAYRRAAGSAGGEQPDTDTAYALCVLQDYRAQGGESCPTLLLSECADRS